MKATLQSLLNSQFAILLSLLIASRAFHPQLNITSDWIIAAGQLAFLPLLSCLAYQWFHSTHWTLVVYSIALMLFVAIPIHIALMFLPGLGTIHAYAESDNMVLRLFSNYVGVFAEEFAKLVPLLLLYRRIARQHAGIDGMAVAFFSGLAFGCFENIGTSASYDFTGSGNVSNGFFLILDRVFFWSVLHAALAGVAAHIVVLSIRTHRLFLHVVLGLVLSSTMHFAANQLPGYRLLAGVLIVATFSVCYAMAKRDAAGITA